MISVILGFIGAFLAFNAVVIFFWLLLPEWLGLEEKKHWPGDIKIKPNKIKNFIGWMYMLVALPAGWFIGVWAALFVLHEIFGVY